MAKATADLRDLDETELETRLAESKVEMFNLRFANVTGQLDNHAELTRVRREIARVNTEIRVRQIAAAEGTR